jgi:hypothetical protein
MANYFQALFKSTSPRHWRQLIEVSFGDWKWFSSFTAMALLIAIGDALLVSAVIGLPPATLHRSWIVLTGVSLIHNLRGILVGDDPTNNYDPDFAGYVPCLLQSMVNADHAILNHNG